MVCMYKNASAFWGTPSPRPPDGALPLDHTGGLCPPDPPTHFAVTPQYFPKIYAYGTCPCGSRHPTPTEGLYHSFLFVFFATRTTGRAAQGYMCLVMGI